VSQTQQTHRPTDPQTHRPNLSTIHTQALRAMPAIARNSIVRMAALGAVASAASSHRPVAPDCTNDARPAAAAADAADADLAAKIESESGTSLSQLASSAQAIAEYWGVDLSSEMALLLRALGRGEEPTGGESRGPRVEMGGTKLHHDNSVGGLDHENSVGALPTALVDEDRLAADLALLMEAPVR
jgi:hypothetical protein